MVKRANRYIENLPEKIKSFREKNNLSQSSLAKKIGISSKSISAYECGRGQPSLAIFAKMIELFGEDFYKEQNNA